MEVLCQVNRNVMKCPHCLTSFHEETTKSLLGEDRTSEWVMLLHDEAGNVIESTSARAISKSGNTSAVLLIIHVGPLIGSAMARQVERAGFCDITYNDGEIAGLKKVASILLFLFAWHALCVLWP
jgi:hypothetical protein